MLLHVSTVHSREDVRIFKKEVMSLAENLGNEVVFLVADDRGDSRWDTPRNVKVVDLGKPRFGRVGRFPFGMIRVLRFIAQHKPQVVHFHDFELFVAAMCSRVFGCKVIYDVHENIAEQIRSKYWIPRMVRRPLSRTVGFIEQFVVRRCSAVVAATPDIAGQFDHPRLVTVHNFPILSEFSGQESLECSDRPAEFCYVGGISEERGIDQMIRAAMRANTQLGLAGSVFPESLLRKLQGCEEWHWVDYRGFLNREEVSTMLRRARAGLVLLHPVDRYMVSYPVKLFEYMATGIPVIASDFPLWREIIENAQCGILVNPLDVDDIASAMRWILDNPEEAQLMGKRGRAAVEEKYCWNAEADVLVKMYQTLLLESELK